MERAIHLVSMLVAMLASQGLEPPSMDAWRGWRTFKHFVRVVDEVPDPGVSVQIVKHDATTRLLFVRQIIEPRGAEWLEPIGGVVLEFSFEDPALETTAELDLWSFDYSDLDQFVDRVEQDAAFAHLAALKAAWSSLYWEQA
jgi:hypothetical protein